MASPPSGTRFTDDGARAMREAIAEAGGIEVFAVGTLDAQGRVVTIEVQARGNEGAVNALVSRARSGQVVIHNHPSGEIRPSEPDLTLAGAFGENGVGFIIVDNAVRLAQWVVEPSTKKIIHVDSEEVVRVLTSLLPAAYPGWEPRPGQVDMALAVAAAFNDGGVVALEAGTGTGKSLGYLVPAVLWAVANDAKVVVSTYTRTLQAQLAGDDLPALFRVIPHRSAVLKGRSNYLCRRKLEVAVRDGTEGSAALVEWANGSSSGDFGELGFELDDDLQDRVESDADQTLRARCPHFNQCFYYEARRRAAAAHLVVVNHALLLRDLATKAVSNGRGVLPDFDRVVLDEAHHLEAAATGAGDSRLSALAIKRAVAGVLPIKRRPGALDRLAFRFAPTRALAPAAALAVAQARDSAEIGFAGLEDSTELGKRILESPPNAEFFAELVRELDQAAAALGAVEAALEEEQIPAAEVQPLLDVQRTRRRLQEQSVVAAAFLAEDEARVRFLDSGKRGVVAANAPLDIGAFVQQHLRDGLHSAVLTSATLAVNGSPEPWLRRVGLAGSIFQQFPSPFDYSRQAVLALPKDLPNPNDPDSFNAVAEATIAAVEASCGGAFVLCTSHDAVQKLAAKLEGALGGRHAILRQGRGRREQLLSRFRDDRGSVLVGTDSFWEGVSVKGDGLRLVVIPRLPFRVPTEPVAAARYERLVKEGVDAFRAWSLPEAVLRLRQGFGRLVRTQSDRGAVVVLDRRVHEMWYGRVFLASLPPARRVVGPTRMVMEQLRAFFAEIRPQAGRPGG